MDRSEQRQRVIDEATAQFRQLGFERVSLESVAAAIGAAAADVQQFFDSAEILLFECVLNWRASASQAFGDLQRLVGQSTIEANLLLAGDRMEQVLVPSWRLTGILRSNARLASEFVAYETSTTAEGTPTTSPMFNVARYLEAEQRIGRIRADVDPYEIAAALVSFPLAFHADNYVSAMVAEPRSGAIKVIASGLEARAPLQR